MVSNFNIPLAPAWEYITDSITLTLVFSALPKCKMFDMVEILPHQAGYGSPFNAFNIKRNTTDVYEITL